MIGRLGKHISSVCRECNKYKLGVLMRELSVAIQGPACH